MPTRLCFCFSNCLALQPSFLTIVTNQSLQKRPRLCWFLQQLSRIDPAFSQFDQTVRARMAKIVLVSTIVLHCITKQPPCTGTNALFLALVLVSLSVSMSLRKLLSFGAVRNPRATLVILIIPSSALSKKIMCWRGGSVLLNKAGVGGRGFLLIFVTECLS